MDFYYICESGLYHYDYILKDILKIKIERKILNEK